MSSTHETDAELLARVNEAMPLDASDPDWIDVLSRVTAACAPSSICRSLGYTRADIVATTEDADGLAAAVGMRRRTAAEPWGDLVGWWDLGGTAVWVTYEEDRILLRWRGGGPPGKQIWACPFTAEAFRAQLNVPFLGRWRWVRRAPPPGVDVSSPESRERSLP